MKLREKMILIIAAIVISSLILAINYLVLSEKDSDDVAKHAEKGHQHENSPHDEENDNGKDEKSLEHSHAEGDGHKDDPKSLEEIAKIKCEHGILQIECKGCRAELGVVELDEKVEKQFLKTEQVSKTLPTMTLDLIGEVGINQLKTVVVIPIVTGRISKVIKKLGDTVESGEVLAILQSQDYGKAKMDYVSAYENYSLAQKSYEWFKMTHENLKKLLEVVKRGEKDLVLNDALAGIKIGKYRKELVETSSQYKVVRAKWERETQVIKNIRKALQLFQRRQNFAEIEKELSALRIGEWKGKLVGALSKLQVFRENYEREQSLVTTNGTTQKEVQQAESDYRSAQGEWQGLVEELSLWTEQKEYDLQAELESSLARYLSTLEESEIDLGVHQKEIEKEFHEAVLQKASMEKMLKLLGLSQQDMQNLLIQNHEDIQNIGELELRSPIGGIVFACNLSEGQFVEASRELYVISDMSSLWVWCDLYESQLAALTPYQYKLPSLQASLKLSNHDESNIPVTMDYLSGKIDEKTRTVKVRGVVKNEKGELKPGQFIKLQLKVPVSKEIITVPEEAIFKDEEQSFLFKKWNDRFWVRSELKLGMKIGDRQEVFAGTSEGDIIASQGGFLLKAEILKSKMGAG